MSLAVSASHEVEYRFLESLRPRYEDEGFEFVIHPPLTDLPDFFASYRPDAIAKKQNQNIAIELKSRATPASQQSIQRIRQLFEGHPEWQLTVAYMGNDPTHSESLPVIDRAFVLERMKEAEELVAKGHLRASFVTAWSLLEAALNSAFPRGDKRPRTPGTVVQTLAIEGHISTDVERSLRALIQLRNRIVHGDLAAEPTEADVRLVLAAVSSTLEAPAVSR